MAQMIDLNKIKKALSDKRVRFRSHSAEMIIERNILKQEVYDTLQFGEVIEEYITDKPFPSYLFFFHNGMKPIHVVCSYNNIDDYVVIITVYIPDDDHFESDFRSRRKK
ncbi:MAG: hypothetical protein CVV49_03465 [Spirochaetae bacterium HGW-Spirochaetae-5]|nr:MAG: hypothetical protein CVV49_03465 [Spirochaetae bacterium HGW-Spirochaetae-5]